MVDHGRFAYLHPAEVRGRFTTLRTWIYGALVLLYLALPWVRIGGKQALLLDLSHRRFHCFGLSLWAHDAPLLFLLMAGGVFALCFATALWGRIWCGYACPQTVYIALLFRPLERLIEGRAPDRVRLAARRGTAEWFAKKALKWGAYAFIALVLSHSFLAYFTGTGRLGAAMLAPPAENWGLFVAMALIAGLVLLDLGWVRERLCFTLCPYGRFQSVLMDRHSLAVVYDAGRGEPRRGTGEGGGDCVACDRCVQVCPTGIDIRQGVQMECIACTACVDACDEVMAKVKKPLGLIRYDTEAGLAGEASGFAPRSWIYLGLTVLMWGGLAAVLLARKDLDVVALRAIGAPYQEVQDPAQGPQIINHLRFDLTNRSHRDLQVLVAFPSAFQAQGFEVVAATNPVAVAQGKAVRAEVFLKVPKSRLDFGKVATTLEFREGEGVLATQDLTLVGPYQ